MKRQKELTDKVIEKARKEKERVLFLQEKIRKAQEEIDAIKESNKWMNNLGESFSKNATIDQQIDFYNETKEIS